MKLLKLKKEKSSQSVRIYSAALRDEKNLGFSHKP